MPTQQTVEPTVIDPEAVAAFYLRRPGTEALARQAVQLVQELFPELQSIAQQVVRDPDEDSEWLCLTVTARLDPAALRNAYRAYLERWIQQTPGDTRHFVRMARREG